MSKSSQSSSENWKISRPKSVRGQVVDTILGRIAEGELLPGATLPSEAILSKEMGISRVALREAIKQLEVLGFVKIKRGSGTVVCSPDFRSMNMVINFLGNTSRIDLKEIRDMVSLLEIEAVRQVATRGDIELVKRLQDILDNAAENLNKEDGYTEFDAMFRKEILEACPNKLFAMMVRPFNEYLCDQSKLLSKSGRVTSGTTVIHRKIVEAIRTTYPEGAKRLMQEHLHRNTRDITTS